MPLISLLRTPTTRRLQVQVNPRLAASSKPCPGWSRSIFLECGPFTSSSTISSTALIIPSRDTVTSVGFTGRTLPFTAHSNIIKTFRQALALDERRCQFRPNPWSSRPYNVSLSITIHAFLETVPIPLAAGGTLTEGALTRGANHETALSLDTRRDILHFDQMLSTIGLTQTVAAAYIWGEEPPSDGKRTDSREVWFAGDHAGENIQDE